MIFEYPLHMCTNKQSVVYFCHFFPFHTFTLLIDIWCHGKLQRMIQTNSLHQFNGYLLVVVILHLSQENILNLTGWDPEQWHVYFFSF